MSTDPPVTSKKRGSRFASVVLPLPLVPTRATLVPLVMVMQMSCSTAGRSAASRPLGAVSYAKVTWRYSMCCSKPVMGFAAGFSFTVFSTASRSKMRSPLAPPRVMADQPWEKPLMGARSCEKMMMKPRKLSPVREGSTPSTKDPPM